MNVRTAVRDIMLLVPIIAMLVGAGVCGAATQNIRKPTLMPEQVKDAGK